MPHFAPATLAHWTSGHWTVSPERALTGFSQDTRTLRPDNIFVALRTDKRDGHDYLTAAQAAGAAAAIVARPNPAITLPQLVVPDPLAAFQKIATEHRAAFQQAGGTVIAITGSAGKTSTKELLALILSEAFGADRVHATEGNLNNHIGVPLTLTRLDPARHRYAIIEAGISAPGEMLPLAQMISPDHALITTIAPAHLEALHDLETIAREKAILLQHVRPNGLRLHGAAAFLPPDARSAPPPSFNLPTHFTSRGMAQNAALAIHLARHLNIPAPQIQNALATWRPAKWRGELMPDPAANRLYYLDLYNANPASMADALDAFARIAPSALPRLYVLGCMEELGSDSARYHRELGQTLSKHLRPQDEAIFIGDHAADIQSGAHTANPAPAKITLANTSAEIAARIAATQNTAIFLKASRRYALEKTLPPGLMENTKEPRA